MLQQTQVDRVLPKYEVLLERFPTAASLAQASPAAVIRLWAGLGYNARAVRLQNAARMVCEGGGRFPGSVPQLLELPGVGRYTAHAVACFAFDEPVAVVDTTSVVCWAACFLLSTPKPDAASSRSRLSCRRTERTTGTRP